MTALARVSAPLTAPSLTEQIAALESELMAQWVSAWPRTGLRQPPARVSGGPRLLSASELELVRDDLALRLADLRARLERRSEEEELSRRLVEQMLLEPEAFPYVRVSHADIGEPGCRHWHVLPRGGLLGRLLKWWRVRISSGCP